MAVVEIAKIQVRRGQEKQTGVPRLSGGEFGWAADTERLYIGLAREDGGSRDANVEILTENHLRNFFSSLAPLASTTTYVYRVGSLITAEDGVNEYERTIQQKLDDIVNVKDFGIVPGDNDNTALLQLAIDNLYLNTLSLSYNPAAKLQFDTGVYNISDTIFIPKNTVILGNGIGNTVIQLVNTGSHIFQTVDSSSAGGIGGYVTFDNSTINSNTQPDNIYIGGLTLRHNSTSTTATHMLSMISLDCANNAVIRDVEFQGNYSVGVTTSTNNTGITIRGYQSLTTENVLVDNCTFKNLCYGIRSNHDIVNPIVQNSKFYDLFKGIVFNDPIDTMAAVGPRFARMVNNRFRNIQQQAIQSSSASSTTSTYHVSMNNQFINVGNNIIWNEQSNTGTAVIAFDSRNNKSVNDYFNRFEFQQQNPNSNYTFNPLVTGKTSLELSAGMNITISGGTADTVLRIPITGEDQLLVINYSVWGGSVSRKGQLMINIGPGSNPDSTITDNYNYTGIDDGNITWAIVKYDVFKWLEVTALIPSGTLTMEHQSFLMV